MKGLKCSMLKLPFLALALLASCLFSVITSSKALAISTEGTFWASDVSSTRFTEGRQWSVSGSFVPGPSTNYIASIDNGSSVERSFTDLCFNFGGLDLGEDAVSYTLSYSVAALGNNSYNSSYELFPPVSGHPGGDHSRNVVLSDSLSSSFYDVSLFNFSVPDVSGNFHNVFSHNISGFLSNTSSDNSHVCFSGIWAYTNSRFIQISQPVLSLYKSTDQQIIDDINSGNDQAHKDSQAQIDAIDNQTKQDKDQYDQEKQEEADRENQGNDDMNEATGIFNFNILNPFAGLWDLFNPNQCTSIPIIAGFVGSKETQYCSWFPNSVRSVLTPAFGIGSIMILFGFVVRWLNGSHSDGSIDIGWDGTFYGNGGHGF